jgi:hypothetical protein
MFVRQQVEALAQQKQDRVVLMPGSLGYGVPTIQYGTDGIGSTLARVRRYHRPDEDTRITGVRKLSLSSWQAARSIPFRRFPLLERKATCVGLNASFVRAMTRIGDR